MDDGSTTSKPDTLVRRVAGVVLLLAAIGVLLAFTALDTGGSAVGILAAALASGLGAGGLHLIIWPAGRRRR